MQGEVCSKGDSPPVCINCGGLYRASSFDCSEYILQRRSRELAACENVLLAEVYRRIRGSTFTPQGSYVHLSTKKFLNLPVRNLVDAPFSHYIALHLHLASREKTPQGFLIWRHHLCPFLFQEISSASSMTAPPPCQECSRSSPNSEQPNDNNNQPSKRYSISSFSQVPGESSTFSRPEPSLLFLNRRTPILAENQRGADGGILLRFFGCFSACLTLSLFNWNSCFEQHS